MDSYRPRPERLALSSRLAKSNKSLRLRTLGKLYSWETLLKRLTQVIEDIAAARRPFIHACITFSFASASREVDGHSA
jgi:hypothetical protein